MKRVNVHLDEEVDSELAAIAARRGQSKASLLRQAAQALLDADKLSAADDPWADYVGKITDAAPDRRHHDEIIYGR